MKKALPKQAILIVNTRSRTGAEAFEEAVALLEDAGVELVETHPIDDPGKMGKVVRRAVARGPMVVVGGGDGTLSTTIDFFKDHDTVFGILPLGTANSFARALGLPLDLAGAVSVIANGIPRRIDLGCIDGDYFGNTASIGLSPLIARTLPHKLKKRLGRVGYALWPPRSASPSPLRLTIAYGDVKPASGRPKSDSQWRLVSRVELVEDAESTAGESSSSVSGKSKPNLLSSWLSNMLKLRSRDQWHAEIRAKQLRLITDPVMEVTIDGELATKTPITVSIAPAAVVIAAPRAS